MSRRTRRHAPDSAAKLEMTPMIDVTFLILIFFMCTLKFRTLEGKLEANLPKDVGAAATPSDELRTELDIRLDVVDPGTKLRRVAEGGLVPYTIDDAAKRRRFVHGDDRVLRYRVGPFTTNDKDAAIARIREVVPQLRNSGNGDLKVKLDPRADVTQQEVVDMVDALVHLGVHDVTFVGSYER